MTASNESRKILAEVYEACLEYRDVNRGRLGPLTHMQAYLGLKLELYAIGRCLFNPHKTDYPLHKAVFENNLPMISRLVNGQCEGIFHCQKNEIDPCGHTPLMLAVKLGYLDSVKVLCDLFACPKLRSYPSCNPTLLMLSPLCP